MLNFIKNLFNPQKEEVVEEKKEKSTKKYSRNDIEKCYKCVENLINKRGGTYRKYFDLKKTLPSGGHPLSGYKWVSEDEAEEIIYFVPSSKN